MELFFIGIASGLLVGSLVGWYVGRRYTQQVSPLFSDDEESVVILQSAHAAVAKRTTRRLDRILEATKTAGRITNDGVEDLFCISDRTASTYLQTLTKTGKLKRQGIGRGTFYTPVD